MGAPLGFQTADDQARIALPPSFAGVKVVVEAVNGSEVRVRRAEENPGRMEFGLDEVAEDGTVTFFEERPRQPLSDRDRDLILGLIENPPEPNDALRRLLRGVKRESS